MNQIKICQQDMAEVKKKIFSDHKNLTYKDLIVKQFKLFLKLKTLQNELTQKGNFNCILFF